MHHELGICSDNIRGDYGWSVELDHAQEVRLETAQFRCGISEIQTRGLLAGFDERDAGDVVKEMIKEDRMPAVDIDFQTKSRSAHHNVIGGTWSDFEGGNRPHPARSRR